MDKTCAHLELEDNAHSVMVLKPILGQKLLVLRARNLPRYWWTSELKWMKLIFQLFTQSNKYDQCIVQIVFCGILQACRKRVLQACGERVLQAC